MAEFKISTNIDRDADSEIDYIVTKNANQVYDRIIHNYEIGQSSFSIIGSYGTGKSSFLWAFEKHLSGDQKFSSKVNGEFRGVNKFKTIRIVGELSSFKATFCDKVGLGDFKDESNKVILKKFASKFNKPGGKGIILLVDEFGKCLEYIAKINPDEMYFIQELAEYCNDPKKNIVFLTTLHQNFSVYSKGLTTAQKNEWNKVRGRLMDIAFDEPVEQLLYFASQRLKSISLPSKISTGWKSLIKVCAKSNLIGKNLVENTGLIHDLYPLDPISADVLVKSLQRYGQNERSLFTFLESPELQERIRSEGVFHVADCFDYLISNLSSEIENGETNPFKPQWKAAILALEKCEFIFEDRYEDAALLIKTICLVNIFSNTNGTLDATVLGKYGECVYGLNNVQQLIDTLQGKGVIKFSKHRNKFNFIEGTDVDIEHELLNASKHIDHDINFVNSIKSFFDFDVIPAKRIQFEKGTPRFFKYNVCEEFEWDEARGEIDGVINLIFTKKKIENKVVEASVEVPKSQIFVLFKNVEELEKSVFDVAKIDYVINKHQDDKVALRILNEERLFHINQLETFVQKGLFNGSRVKWIWNGEVKPVRSDRELNAWLSKVADDAYPATPYYRNEMVNKEFLSTPVLTARKALIKQMIDHGAEKDLGFLEDKFPPEKTIYMSLLAKTGIHGEIDNSSFGYTAPTEQSFVKLWNVCCEILKESTETKKTIEDFFIVLRKGEFKLKQGFLDFWVPIFLIVKKEDYSLYSVDGDYIPHLTSDVMDLLYKKPSKYYVKGLSANGVQSEYLNYYLDLLEEEKSNVSGLKSTYITIYSNFLKFYRGLPEYSKKTKQITKEAIGVRNAIANASDPEDALINKIPQALNYHNIKDKKQVSKFLGDLQASIRHIRGAYDNLIDAIETAVKSHLDIQADSFVQIKEGLLSKFQYVNAEAIVDDQIKRFHVRVMSPLDNQKAYWESICDVTIGKRLDKISDDDVKLLINRLKGRFDILNDLIDIHKEPSKKGEEVVQIKILNSTGTRNTTKNIVLTEKNRKEADKLTEQLSKLLNNSGSEVNKSVLLSLLEKELKRDE